MNRTHITRIVIGTLTLIAIVTIFGSFQPQVAEAGIYSENNETLYQEIWISHDEFTADCSTTSGGKWYLEPYDPSTGQGCEKSLEFTLPNINDIDSIEIYIDYWRNRDSQLSRFYINNQAPIQPNVGSDWSRTPYIHNFGTNPAGDGFVTGTNTITFMAGGYHVHDVAIRVYYKNDANVVVADGQLGGIVDDNGRTDPYFGNPAEILQVDTDQLVFTATITSGDADWIEFHAFYDGYDEDNDGDFTDWHNLNHNNWNPGGNVRANNDPVPTDPYLGGTINHIGSIPVNGAGVYTATWNLPHVINQPNVRFKIRIVDQVGSSGTLNVREAAGGDSRNFVLGRSNPTAYFMIPNFEDEALYHGGDSGFDTTYTQYIDLPPDISDFDTAYMVGAYWNNLKISINDNAQMDAFPGYNLNGRWQLSILGPGADYGNYNIYNYLQPGENKITYTYWGNGFGSFIEKPGPMIVLKRESGTFNPNESDPPILYDETPEDGAVFVDQDSNISVKVLDTGTGIDPNSVSMTVEGASVTPVVTGQLYNAEITYNPPSDFAADQEVNVSVTICDNASTPNCATKNWSFTVTPGDTGFTAVSDDFNICTLGDKAPWTIVDPIGDGSVSLENAEKLVLNVPAGVEHDFENKVNNTVRLMQPANNAPNFLIETKFESVPTEKFQIQGVLIEESENRFMRADLYHDGTTLRLYVASYERANANDNFVKTEIIATGNAVNDTTKYLRIFRTENTWRVEYSTNGTSWQKKNNGFNYVMNVSQVGVYAGNASTVGTPPGFTAKVDYFNNFLSDPIADEDGETLILPVILNGNGQVARSVSCGKPVTLTATPELGWQFDNWGGIASGTNPQITINDWEADESVTANFSREEYTLTVNVNSVTHDGQTDPPAPGGAVQTPNQPVYYYGDQVTITAVPEPGWSLSGWNGAGLSGKQLSKTFTMTQSETIIATFTQDKYDVDLGTTGSFGNVTKSNPPGGRGYYIYGDQITVTAVETNPDWKFRYWSGDASGTRNPLIIPVTGDMTIIANFSDEVLVFLPLMSR